jgi:hypothetical protein
MTEITGKVAATVVDPAIAAAAAKAAQAASSIHDRIVERQDEIAAAFEHMDIAESDGAYPAALAAAQAFGLTPDEVASWRPGARSVKESVDPVENSIRTAHNVFKPEHSPASRVAFARMLRLACHAAGEDVVADARGSGEGQFRQKNLPVVTADSRTADPELATQAKALAALKDLVRANAQDNNRPYTFRVDPIKAIENAEDLATLSKQLAVMTVQGGNFQASLLTHLYEDAFKAECQDRGVAPAKVWLDAAKKAKAALAACDAGATKNEVLEAMRTAARSAVANSQISATTVKAVTATVDQIVAAENALYASARRLFSLGKINQDQLDAIRAVMIDNGLRDKVGEEAFAAAEAKRLRDVAAAKKKEEDAKRAQEMKDAKDAAAKVAPVQASESGEAASADKPARKPRAKFTPAPVEAVPDTASEDRDAALAELDNA